MWLPSLTLLIESQLERLHTAILTPAAGINTCQLPRAQILITGTAGTKATVVKCRATFFSTKLQTVAKWTVVKSKTTCASYNSVNNYLINQRTNKSVKALVSTEKTLLTRNHTFPETICFPDCRLPQPQRSILWAARVQLSIWAKSDTVNRPKVPLVGFCKEIVTHQ